MQSRTDFNSTNQQEDTGRYLIFFHPEGLKDVSNLVNNTSGINMISSSEEAEFRTASAAWEKQDTIVIPSIGVAVCPALPDQMNRLEQGKGKYIRCIRKEYIFKKTGPAFNSQLLSPDYLRGYLDATNGLIDKLLGTNSNGLHDFEALDGDSFRDNDQFTWGLQATGINNTGLTGRGIKVAILDTGLDFTHPDFSKKQIQSQSFINGVNSAQDDNTHGTHTYGTLCGPRIPSQGRRYGVASDAEVLVGKVLNAEGKGKEGDILNGIGWAIQNKCRIISLSLGKAVSGHEGPDNEYEEIGKFALLKNCIIMAAAGNDSNRPNPIEPVNIPANSSKIMAVGAIDRRMGMYAGSNGGLNPNGGGIDIAGPGVDVYSSKSTALRYGNETGTSMATPHAAGIAALLMQQDPNATAEEIWTRLTQSAKRLPLPNRDIGSGLVQITA